MSGDNLAFRPNGRRDCRTCKSIRRRAGNPEAERARNKAKYARYREAYLERARTRTRSLSPAQKERNRELQKAWARANPERWRALKNSADRRREALKKSAIGLWDADWFIERQLFLYQDGRCFYCRRIINLLDRSTYHLEHCTALSKGGLHCATNVVLSCPPCNRRKQVMTAADFLRSIR